MCSQEVNPEVFSKYRLSKAAAGSGGGWKMEHKWKQMQQI